jgi:hypothetical protein
MTPFQDPNRTIASDAAMVKYGPSSFELIVTDGVAVRLRLANPLVTNIVATRIDKTTANITWTAPIASQFSGLGSANVTTAGAGIVYSVYYVRRGASAGQGPTVGKEDGE